MILEVVQSKWSLTWYDPLGPRMCVLELMNGHVLQTLREQLKVPGSRLEGSELLTSEFLRFRSRLNETSGGLGKIGAVSGSDCRILKFLRTTFLAAKLLGWKVSVKGILPGHSHEHMEICGIYLHLGNNETRKRKEQRLIFKLGTLAPNGINERFSFA